MMNRRISSRTRAIVGVIAIISASLFGAVSDLGAPESWVIATAIAAIPMAYVIAQSRHRQMLVAEAATIVLVAVVAVLGIALHDARHDLTNARRDLRSTLGVGKDDATKTFDYVVSSGEDDPNSTFSDSLDPPTTAYKRLLPTTDSPLIAEESAIRVGSHIRVVCEVLDDDPLVTWYRLGDGSFMDGGVVEPAPYSGSSAHPPACRGPKYDPYGH